MTDPNNSPPNGPTSRRRSSFAGQAFADLFGGGRNRASTAESSSSPPGQYAGPITAAAAQANQRRLSLATSGLGNGLNGSPPGTGAYFGGRARGDSVSSSNNASVDESAIDEDPASAGASQPTTPFARRVSFGARALRDLKPGGAGSGGNNGNNGRVSTSTIPEESIVVEDGGGGVGGKQGRSSPIDVAGSAKHTVPTTARGRGLSSSSTTSASSSFGGRTLTSPFGASPPSTDVLTVRVRIGESGFNWADNMRTRAERTSIGGASMGTSPNTNHVRAKSIATMEQQPVRAAPKPAPLDHTQERILKGDFYMD